MAAFHSTASWDTVLYSACVVTPHQPRAAKGSKTAFPAEQFLFGTSHGTLALSPSIPLNTASVGVRTKTFAPQAQIHHGPVYAVQSSPAKPTLIASAGDDVIALSDISADGSKIVRRTSWENPREFGSRGIGAALAETNGLAFRSDGNVLYSAAGDTKGYAWDIPAASQRRAFVHHTKYLHCIAASGENMLATGSEDGTVAIWDARQNEPIRTVAHRDTGWVGAVAIDPNGSWLVLGTGSGGVFVHHLLSGTLLSAAQTDAAVQTIAISPLDNSMTVGGASNVVTKLDRSGNILATSHTQNIDSVWSIWQHDNILLLAGASPRAELRIGLDSPAIFIDASPDTADAQLIPL